MEKLRKKNKKHSPKVPAEKRDEGKAVPYVEAPDVPKSAGKKAGTPPVGSVISVKEAEKADRVIEEEERKSLHQEADNRGFVMEGEDKPMVQPFIARNRGSPIPGRPLTPEAQQSASPKMMKRNVVEPSPGVMNEIMGSAVTLQSKEAWMDRPGTAASFGRKSSKETADALNKSLVSLRDQEDEINEHHAYVPYVYARDCVRRMVEDMKKMKTNHVRIVHDIEFNYKAIEGETQSQFNAFVMSLRTQYAQKVQTFRQVIEVHRLELQQKQQYWDEALASLSSRNKVLLLDKKSLLVQNRVEYERMEQEKGDAVSSLTRRLDDTNVKLSRIQTDMDGQFDKERQQYEMRLEQQQQDYDEEIKIIQEELNTEKSENEKLKQILEDLQNNPLAGAAVVATVAKVEKNRPKDSRVKGFKAGKKDEEGEEEIEKTEEELQKESATIKREPTVIVTDMSQDERRNWDEERNQMEAERREIMQERQELEQERGQVEEDRKKFQEDRVILQGELNNANKDAEMWKAKYDALKHELRKLGQLQAKNNALQAQFDAVLSVAVIATEEDKKRADDMINKAKDDKTVMEEQKEMLEQDAKQWNDDFKRKNMRDPTPDDHTDSMKETITSLDEANGMIDALNIKVDTLENLKRGETPDTPEVKPLPVVIPDPEVKVVELRVPDPEVIAQLEMTQAELDALRKQVMALKNRATTLQSQQTQLKSRLGQAKAEINKLMAANQELEDQLRRAGAGAGAVALATTAKNGVDPVEHAEMKAELEKQLRQTENDLRKELQDKQEDYEARIKQLEKEKKMMERDIKKLLKAHAKLKQKMTAKEDHYNEILPVVIQQVHEIHRLYLPASEMVGDRLREAETNQTKVKRDVEKASKEYESWELGWAEENGKEPTEADREMDSDGRLLFDEQGKSKKNMKDQDNLVVALTMMKTGLVPDLKHKQEKTVGETQSAAKDAILEEAAGTEDKIEDLENHISDLDSDNQALKAKVQRLEEKIASLEAELEEAKEKAGQLGVTAAVASAGTSQEDIEALKKAKAELEELLRQKEEELQKEQQEKEESKKQCTILDAQLREMEKDIKKMIKQYNKLKEKAKSDGVTDPSKLEEKITELEEKIIDMEGDRDTLIDQNKKQEEKVNKLDQELDEAKQRLALLSGAAVGAASAEDVEALRRAKAELEALLRQTKDDLDKESLAKQTLEKQLQDKEDEKKEMEKDMKKMMKQYQKLKDKLKGEDGEEANIAELENKIIDLETDKESLSNKAEQQDNKITELERELEDAKARVAELSGVAAVAVTAEDAEDLRKALTDLENQLKQKDADIQKLNQTIKDLEGKLQDKEDQRKEMEKDMKKMMRQYQKLKDQGAGKPTDKDGIDEKLSDLENKVIELEADNNSLKETKQDLNEKIKNLEAELETVAAAAPSATAAGALAGAAAASELRQEKMAHDMTKEELEALRRQIKGLKADLKNVNADAEAKLKGATSKLQADINNLSKALEKNKERVAELEKARIENMPVDAKKEIKAMQVKLTAAEKEKDANLKEMANTEGQVQELKAKVASLEQNNKQLKQEISELQNRLRAQGRAPSARPGAGRGGDAALKVAQEKLQNLRRENQELKQRIKELEVDAKKGRIAAAAGGGDSGIDPKLLKRHEKILKELEKRLENETNKNKKNEENLMKREQELKEANKDIRGKDDEINKLRAELSSLGVAAKEGVEAAQKVKSMEKEVKKLTEENKTLAENFNSERVLRKKYYNMVEDMKGKIRVYCRARPMSKSENQRGNYSVVKSPDEYTINVDSQRGMKEFQFDQIFMPEHSQEKVFEDTNNLIQSAVDGYNVCIFAYGQTGSGKTYTMIGDKEQTQPGIAPRAFNRLFEVMEENKSKFRFKVTSYMMELYNDKLLDLYAKPGASSDDKFDIKKDKKGLVYVQGAEIKAASNSKELFALFEEGSKNRHTASTKMNADSSRSHLVLAVIIESINKTSGQVMKGKLSLVDLAGSERAAKTQASAEQLKEAMSINKSLSALGDVISALSSEQAFIPYRNNKLTMLMQDSLGGNAKTLMFVNISPADYNTDETVISLTYASRVKLITNDASKNADNKEIARLRQIINKMKKGESVEEEGD